MRRAAACSGDISPAPSLVGSQASPPSEYELRPSHRGVQYRILYFFRDRDVVVLSHGIMKRQKVPDVEIRRAAERKRLVLADPQRYSFRLVPKEV